MPLALMYMGYFAWKSSGKLEELINQADIKIFIVSIFLWVTLQLLSPLFTAIVFRGWNVEVTYRELLIIHANRLPAKYIPGGIWHSVARIVDYKTRGLDGKKLSLYFLLENIVAASVTLVLGGFVVICNLQEHDVKFYSVLAVVLFSLLIIVLTFFVVTNDSYIGINKLKVRYLFLSISTVVLFWIFASTSFVFFIHAFDGLNISGSYIEIAGIYIFSWGVGFIALFAPQGFGVSEYVSAQLLGSSLSLNQFIVLLVGYRILIAIADILTWFLSKIYGLYFK
ncbi:MAG: hypothetical protein KUG76_08210 [Gammaproteobacteria bacterium]|nr:hypothetical protein [Gammaproteobacteria bacterium]